MIDKRNINILFVHYLERVGGGERYLINVINSLPENYNIFLLTPNNNCELEAYINKPIHKISKKFIRNLGPFPSFSLTLFTTVYGLIKNEKIDVIHLNDHYLLPSFVFFRLKVIFTSHGMWDVYFIINKMILKTINPITIASTPIQYSRLKHLVDDLHLLPFFNSHTVEYKRKTIGDIVNIGIVGRFSPVKNHQLAFSVSSCPDCLLHVYGEKTLSLKEESDSYEASLLNMMNANKSIVYHGFEADLENIYKNIDILIITSKTESFSLVNIEAYSYGVPVLSTMTEGSSSLIIDGYNGFICSNKEDFCEKIKIICNNYASFSKNAYKSSLKHTKDGYMKGLLPLYEKIL